jgi:hypothetical protein
MQRIGVAAKAGADQSWLADAAAQIAKEHRGRRVVARAGIARLLGSVPPELVQRSRRPVLVITPPQGEERRHGREE